MRKTSYASNFTFNLSLPLFDASGVYIKQSNVSLPEYNEILSTKDLTNSSHIIKDLRKIDWSFTKESTGFLTHDLHPYPAKYIPQIPGHIICRLSLRGDLVLDPFAGCGTTALEAVRLGRRAVCVDANPIGILIGKVKTSNLDKIASTDLHAIRSAIASRLRELPTNPADIVNEFGRFIPEIPNIDKWFPLSSRGELALIKSRIETMDSETGKNIAKLALSRIAIKVSYQDSETRYSSKPKDIKVGETLKSFLLALDDIIKNVSLTQSLLRYGVCNFITADIRKLDSRIIGHQSVDLIVTSPPYGNANDYHLYHRFRLFWLGHDPKSFGKIEIGSHLRHQKEVTGFEEYLSEMGESLELMFRVLKTGRYAVFVVGDPIYESTVYDGAGGLSDAAKNIGFEKVCVIERAIHQTKRSFVKAGRRATSEKILVLKKPIEKLHVFLDLPPYKLWPYEKNLRNREISARLETRMKRNSKNIDSVRIDPYRVNDAKRLVFTHHIARTNAAKEPTWQAIIENGFGNRPSARKDPKYVTHGLHAYKGKFYPQLAKALLNLCGLDDGAKILDPFCGSGTTLLEGYLNGFQTYGCDMNPLAGKIAKVKVGILDVDPDVLRESIGTLLSRIDEAPTRLANNRSQFNPVCYEEIERWFAVPVINKLNWLIKTIRGTGDGIIMDFFEVILSSIIRSISHQDPNDLRIRRRKVLLEDADVFSLYVNTLQDQYHRIEKFWAVRGYAPNRFYPSQVVCGDSRQWEGFDKMGIDIGSMDLVLTSPPYATALPYIDTDRLSLLLIFGLNSGVRRPLEHRLIGSREIVVSERKDLEDLIISTNSDLPNKLQEFLLDLHSRMADTNVGFRRKNMPALLLRFFQDMTAVLKNCYSSLHPGGKAMIVVGDNRMSINGKNVRIATTNFVDLIAKKCGFQKREHIDISVTTENLVHIKNAITKNEVLYLERPI